VHSLGSQPGSETPGMRTRHSRPAPVPWSACATSLPGRCHRAGGPLASAFRDVEELLPSAGSRSTTSPSTAGCSAHPAAGRRHPAVPARRRGPLGGRRDLHQSGWGSGATCTGRSTGSARSSTCSSLTSGRDGHPSVLPAGHPDHQDHPVEVLTGKATSYPIVLDEFLPAICIALISTPTTTSRLTTACGCRKPRPPHATWAYSWTSPPSRSSRTTRTPGAGAGEGAAPSGGACPSERCGRCWL